MPASSRTPQRRRRSARVMLATACVLVASAGCSGEPVPEQPQETPTVEATPLEDYDTGDLTLARGEFCERVGEDAITAALGAEAAETTSWEPGRRLPGTRDISNEFGCSWTSGAVTARAWVFAPPITAPRAADFAEETVARRCERLATAATPGTPGAAQHCAKAPALTGVYGLVGDAWVGCEVGGLSASRDDAAVHVGEWCVAVLEALRTG